MLENKGERVGCSLGVWEKGVAVWASREDAGTSEEIFLIFFIKNLFYCLSTKYLRNLNLTVKKL